MICIFTDYNLYSTSLTFLTLMTR